MNAPDKIYVDTDLIAFHVMNERLNEVDVEYIRKDALLKWLEHMLESTANSFRFSENQAYAKVIDKINSLNP